MFPGQTDNAVELFSCQHALLAKRKSFTLVEVLVTAFILILIIGGLMMSLSTGESTFPVNSARIDLQAKARSIVDWVARDVRQGANWDIANNSPSDSHIKFRKVEGIDTGSGNYLLSTDYIEYSYDSGLEKLNRYTVDSGGTILETWEFTEIVNPPFYTRDASGDKTTDESNFSSNLLNSKKLIIEISAEKEVRRAIVTASLEVEVKVRNG